MTDRFPTSADLRDAARRLPNGPAALRLLALADALDAGARIVEAGPVRELACEPAREPVRTCLTCRWSSDDMTECARLTEEQDAGHWDSETQRWCDADGNLDDDGRPLPTATPCPGFADKVTT